VPGDDWVHDVGQFVILNVQVRTADTAGGNPDQYLMVPRFGDCVPFRLQFAACAAQNHRAHRLVGALCHYRGVIIAGP